MMVKLAVGSKKSKILTITASSLLVVMALFHGSGIHYVTTQIELSNSESFLKEIVPVLFAHPSIHLLGLAAFGILTLFMRQEVKKVVSVISVFILIDALIAFYLRATIPGGLLLASAACFISSTLGKA